MSRWTRYFTVASAVSFVATEAVVVFGGRRALVVTVALFGFVCPMIFGMAYLLIPSLVGRTLADYRLPGVHFALAYAGTAGLVAGRVTGITPLSRAGAGLWSLGVAFFVGVLAWTVAPVLRDRLDAVTRSRDGTRRSPRLATAMIPISLGYLVFGTVGLLGWTGLGPLPSVSFPAVVHYYGAGMGALLIFALGARLLPGFFHVTPPRAGLWVVSISGSVGPAILAASLWAGVAFRVGAVLQTVAMVGYAGVVGYVFRESEWRRPGGYGILLGATGGVVAVGINLPAAFGTVVPGQLYAHATTVITGFFALTIVGYAVQFFAVTSGRFAGATTRAVLGTMAVLAVGVLLRAGGLLAEIPYAFRGGAVLVLCGAAAYAYLIGRRLLGE